MKNKKSAYTLIELMVVILVMAVLSTALYGFYVITYRNFSIIEEQFRINSMLSNISDFMGRYGQEADTVAIFPGYYNASLRTGDHMDSFQAPDNSGNLLVFVFYNDSPLNPTINRMIGFYRDRANQIRRFVTTNIPSPRGSIQANIPPISQDQSHTVIASLSSGSSANRLFTNLYNAGVMVTGELTFERADGVTQTFDLKFSFNYKDFV